MLLYIALTLLVLLATPAVAAYIIVRMVIAGLKAE